MFRQVSLNDFYRFWLAHLQVMIFNHYHLIAANPSVDQPAEPNVYIVFPLTVLSMKLEIRNSIIGPEFLIQFMS